MKIKNSNRVLLLILFLTLSIPLLVAMVLRHKVKTGQFQIVEDRPLNEDPALVLHGQLDGAKAIKLVGMADAASASKAFKVLIVHNAQRDYLLKKGKKSDSMQVQRLGDTLCLSYYMDKAESKKEPFYRNYGNLTLLLNLPEGMPVFVDNCSVQFTSNRAADLSAKNDPVTRVYLKNNAELEIGNEAIDYEAGQELSELRKVSSVVLDSTADSRRRFDSTFVSMGKLQVVADNSTVRIIQPVAFGMLELQLKNMSVLSLPVPFKTSQLTGNLAPDTEIKGALSTLKTLKPLLND